MEIVELTIPYKRSDTFHIYPIGDIHAASIHCAEEAIKAEVTKAANQKHAIVIGMGDYCDSILKNDPRFDIEALAPWLEKGNIIESQRRWVRNLLEPIKDKIAVLLTGNHEEEEHLRFQNDITRNLCSDLNVPYGGYSCFLVLTFKRNGSNESHQYVVHVWHGAGSAQTEGARLMRLMRLVNEIQAHIYLMGHLHAMTQHTPDRLIYNRGRVKSMKLAATITGSWLKAYTQPKGNQKLPPSYAEKKGYKPSRIGCPVIHIHPDSDEFTIES